MYSGLPKEYDKKFYEFFKKRRHWLAVTFYDNSIIAFALTREKGKGQVSLSSLKRADSQGIKAGRIVNSHKAAKAMKDLLTLVSDEAGIKDNRLTIGLDIPSLLLTPKQWTDNTCLNVPCNENLYNRILHNIVRESTIDHHHIIEIIPLEISVDKRSVEDPCGITGQITINSMFVSQSNQNRKDLEACLREIKYKCEYFVSGFHNLCTAFSTAAVEDEYVLLIDLKFNSTDVIMFKGDQPVDMKCYPQGLDEIIIESLSSILSISRNETIHFFEKYINSDPDKGFEIIGKNELPARSMDLQFWEFHEIVTTQLKNFIFMAEGFNDWVIKFHSEHHAVPRKIIITGKGSLIPKIDDLFAESINLKCEVKNWELAKAHHKIPATAYGMIRSIVHDTGVAVDGLKLNKQYER